MRGFIVSLLTFVFVLMTAHLGELPLITGLVLLEIASVRWARNKMGFSIMVAIILAEFFLMFKGENIIDFNVLIAIGIYLVVRQKGDSWFVDNKISSYVYLLFAISVPVFLTFVTLLADIEWNLLMFTTLYLMFLRISDHIITKRIPMVLFICTQTFALNIFNGLGNIDDMVKALFIVALVIWGISKWHQGGQRDVSRILTNALYREGSQGVYKRLS